MTRWSRWHPHAGSLRRFLLLWLLGGQWLIVAGFTVWQLAVSAVQLSSEQHAVLLRAISDVAARGEPNNAPSPSSAPPWHLLYRVDTMAGEWLSGERELSPFAWRSELAGVGAPVFYLGQHQGTLMRMAAAQRMVQLGGSPTSAVVQVASPWRDSLPDARSLYRSTPLAWCYAGAALMSLVIWAGVSQGLRWLARARSTLQAPASEAEPYDGPSELQPAVQRVRELQHSQQRWVEEQRRFLADASHQLRTPMAVLRTQLQSMLAGDVSPTEALPQMLHTVDRATGLANQLLSLTKLEQIKRSGQLKPVDLQEAARDAVMELAPLIAAKRLDFALEGPPLYAPGDPVMLGELLRNLLANAIHHTPANGRLGMLLRDGTGRAELVVWDEGPGVDDEVRARLFQPFNAGRGGVGLGLSICKQIGEAMGASVDLYNRISNDQVIGVDAVVAWSQGP